MGVPDGPSCPVLFPHRLEGCLLRSEGNIASRAPPPQGTWHRGVQNTPLICLTLHSLQSTSPFATGILLSQFINRGVSSPVCGLPPPERALSISPSDLFNSKSEPLSHGWAAVNSIPVTRSLCPHPPPPAKIWASRVGAGSLDGPWRVNKPLVSTSVPRYRHRGGAGSPGPGSPGPGPALAMLARRDLLTGPSGDSPCPGQDNFPQPPAPHGTLSKRGRPQTALACSLLGCGRGGLQDGHTQVFMTSITNILLPRGGN